VIWKAISLSRPWDYAIIHLGKRLENRADKRGMPPMCRYRGPLLLHAAKSWDPSAVDWMRERNLVRPGGIGTTPAAHPSGFIVGRCNVVGHVEPWDCSTCGQWPPHKRLDCTACEGTARPRDLDWRWWMGGYALILADVEPLPLTPCKGALGLWTPPPGVLASLRIAA
jgi:hypothetical protein